MSRCRSVLFGYKVAMLLWYFPRTNRHERTSAIYVFQTTRTYKISAIIYMSVCRSACPSVLCSLLFSPINREVVSVGLRIQSVYLVSLTVMCYCLIILKLKIITIIIINANKTLYSTTLRINQNRRSIVDRPKERMPEAVSSMRYDDHMGTTYKVIVSGERATSIVMVLDMRAWFRFWFGGRPKKHQKPPGDPLGRALDVEKICDCRRMPTAIFIEYYQGWKQWKM